MIWNLFEPFCGTASLTLHLLGAKRALLPYQGSKWRYRKPLEAVVRSLGFKGSPCHVDLTDIGPLGRVMDVVGNASARREVVKQLQIFEPQDPRHVFARLQGNKTPRHEVDFATQFLFLQRLSFSGKAVGVKDGRWSSPGFNATSAYGTAATSRFGEVKPMVSSLISVLEGYDKDLSDGVIFGRIGPADLPIGRGSFPTLAYLDPPYQNQTDYPNGTISRKDVVALAKRLYESGISVIVSESEAIEELVEDQWDAKRLSLKKADGSPFKGKQEEWVTYRAAST